MDFSYLNTQYASLSPHQRLEKLFKEYEPEKILVTSSFGSTSFVLLHMISQLMPNHPIHFVNTSYLFEETIAYKDLLATQLNLNLIEVKSPENRQKFTQENQSWRYNQDLCCFINKVDPVNQLRSNYDFWISGLLRYQNANRQKINTFDPKSDIIKFHPIIDMTVEEVNLYQTIYDLPSHQLVAQGFNSIGCTHCTQKGVGRAGRWGNIAKTECGLHV